MQTPIKTITALCALVLLGACVQDSQSRGGVYLPPGDAAEGQEHFVALGCVACHTVVGADLPEPAADSAVRVLLGSRTGRSLSYGELITSIVNPSHRLASRYREDQVAQDGESMMAVYNDVMTVTQLTHLVAFLQAHYEESERPGYKYPTYKYGADE